MIRLRRRWMTYTYFNRRPDSALFATHLFAMARRWVPGMVRVPFPTLTVDLGEPDFVRRWSDSTRTKINRAARETIEIRRGRELLSDILMLFRPTSTLRGLRGYEKTHFDPFPHIECAAAYFEGVMLCGHVWVVDDEERRAMLYVNATRHHDRSEDGALHGRSHYYLLWQDGLYLGQQGVATLDLQGYEPDTTDPWLKGVYQWKAGTHGTPETLYHYYPAWFYLFRRIRESLGR